MAQSRERRRELYTIDLYYLTMQTWHRKPRNMVDSTPWPLSYSMGRLLTHYLGPYPILPFAPAVLHVPTWSRAGYRCSGCTSGLRARVSLSNKVKSVLKPPISHDECILTRVYTTISPFPISPYELIPERERERGKTKKERTRKKGRERSHWTAKAHK